MTLPPVFNPTFHMNIALQKHSGHINILLNHEDLRKGIYLPRHGWRTPNNEELGGNAEKGAQAETSFTPQSNSPESRTDSTEKVLTFQFHTINSRSATRRPACCCTEARFLPLMAFAKAGHHSQCAGA